MVPKKMSKQEKMFYGAMAGLGYLFIMFFLCHFFKCHTEGAIITDVLTEAIIHMQTQPLDIFPIPLWNLCIATFVIGLFVILYTTENQRKKRMRPGKEEGSAKWMSDMKKYNKQYTSPKGKEDHNGEDNMIFTNDVFMSMDTRQTRRNNNVLIIGGSGAGKSRFFVKPNLLQANCSYVITDPSGELLESCGGFLEKQGYEVKIFNLVEMQYSNHYNPFNYIRDDEGVLMMINCLIKNTTPEGASKGDPFWEKSETALLLAICFYLQYEVRKEDRNFANVMKLLLLAEVKEDQEDFKSTLDIMFEQLEKKNPNHIAVRYYKIFKMGAGKTLKSILISCTVRLGVFNLIPVKELTNIDTIDLKTIGDKKTALFVVIPAADDTFNFLVSMMYSQLFETLYFHAENEAEGKRLKYHVRFMLDEFANIGTIPNFEKKLATMRKYEISCSIILQNLAQLKTMYKDAWESITGNCDSFLFLGGQEQTTLEYVSKKLGKESIIVKGSSNSKGRSGSYSQSYNVKGRDLMTPDEISRMDNKNCILFIRGLFPFFSEKYDYPKHKNYKYTGDADKKQNYEYRSVEKFEVKAAPKNKTKSKTTLIKAGQKKINLNKSLPSGVREKTKNNLTTFEISGVTPEHVKAMGVTENEKETMENINLVSSFTTDYEFKGSEEYSSSFLDDEPTEPEKETALDMSKEEVLEEKENEVKEELSEEASFTDEFDVPLEPDFEEEEPLQPDFESMMPEPEEPSFDEMADPTEDMY